MSALCTSCARTCQPSALHFPLCLMTEAPTLAQKVRHARRGSGAVRGSAFGMRALLACRTGLSRPGTLLPPRRLVTPAPTLARRLRCAPSGGGVASGGSASGAKALLAGGAAVSREGALLRPRRRVVLAPALARQGRPTQGSFGGSVRFRASVTALLASRASPCLPSALHRPLLPVRLAPLPARLRHLVPLAFAAAMTVEVLPLRLRATVLRQDRLQHRPEVLDVLVLRGNPRVQVGHRGCVDQGARAPSPPPLQAAERAAPDQVESPVGPWIHSPEEGLHESRQRVRPYHRRRQLHKVNVAISAAFDRKSPPLRPLEGRPHYR
mmetsp:Transcript_93959/g.298280  ORF Transcript_93959/g.298280 Transcript_93959/m.298280 type:complete len:324 (-) Transcript_93959:724-1695(-)